MTDLNVLELIKKANEAGQALYALQYTQAALNAANALRVLAETPPRK